nr:sigma-70 family RNA polymerase sigma factor [Micromonospora sp. DSM 115978]
MRADGVRREASRELVVRARSGDQAAIAELVSVSLPLVYNVIRRALGDHADVDDLVQESMIRMLRGLSGLREPDQFRSWVTTIAYRQVRDHWRRQPSVVERPVAAPDEFPDDTADFADRTVAELLISEQRRALTEATGWLGAGDRHLLALWWQETTGDLSRAELAAALGVGERHLAVRLRRMRTQLDTARAIVRALRDRPRCPDLARLAGSWNDERSDLWRKRFGRHVRDCPRCVAHRQGLVPPERLLFGLTALPVPALLADMLRATLAAEPAVPAVAVAGQGPLHLLLSHKLGVAASSVAVVAAGALFAVHVTPFDGVEPGVAAPPAAGPILSTPTTAPRSPATAAPETSAPAGPTPPTGVTGVTNADIFVAPTGDDAADGSRDRPFATLNRAVEVVRPGQTIAMRGGTYRLTREVSIGTSGTEDQRILLSGYRGERAVLDAAGLPVDEWAVTQQTSFWTVQDIEVRGSRSHAWTCTSCRHGVFQRLSIHDNARSGLTLRGPGTVGNQVLDSDFYRNYDPADNGGAGIGLGVKFGDGEGNVVSGNRAFHNADDGFDFGAFHSPLTIENNWSYGNGHDRWNVADWDSNGFGFSLGGGEPTPSADHRVRNNAAWDNRGDGFGVEANSGAVSLVGNTAYRNGGDGFDLTAGRGTARDNLAIDNAEDARVGPGVAADDNSWDGTGWSRTSLRSTDPAVAEGRRRADGSLPRTGYLATGGRIGADLSG